MDTDVVIILVGTYHDLALTQTLQIIMHQCHLGKARRCFILSLVATQQLPSRVKARHLCGMLGRPMGRSQKHLSILHATCACVKLSFVTRWMSSCQSMLRVNYVLLTVAVNGLSKSPLFVHSPVSNLFYSVLNCPFVLVTS